MITVMVYIASNLFIKKTEIPVNSEQTLKKRFYCYRPRTWWVG